MDSLTAGNLEEELGYLEAPLIDVAPSRDHASNSFYEPPSEHVSRLSPPSKTKSIYPFGHEGTLAWATPAGELLQVASCIDNELIGVECKRLVEKGDEYDQRGRMLVEAVQLPQGSGCGIGLSLADDLQPSVVSWVQNRWPRFTYHYNNLDIKLQYYVDSESRSIIQQYQVCNNSSSEVSLPYVVSSDACFRKHGSAFNRSHSIPSGKSHDRLLLFNNSEILLDCAAARASFRMSVFLNAQRLSLWNSNSVSSSEEAFMDDSMIQTEDAIDDQKMEGIENDIRQDVLSGSLGWNDRRYRYRYRMRFGDGAFLPQRRGREERNLAEHRNTVVIPAGSTQELCAIIRISHTLRPEIQSEVLQANRNGTYLEDDPEQDPPLSEEQNDSLGHEINRKQSELEEKLRFSTQPRANSRRERLALASELARSSLNLGAACTEIGWIGEARYHFYVAYLIALAAHGESSIISIGTCLQYAKCLDDNGWHVEALKTTEHLLNVLTTKKAKEKAKEETIVLSRQIQGQVASLYLKIGNFAKAEATYHNALLELPRNEPSLAAQYKERIAWTQAHQHKNEQARKNYQCLLEEHSSQRQTILSNLGFIMRRLGRLRDARSWYEKATDSLSSNNIDSVANLHAHSGLFSCFGTVGSKDKTMSQVSVSLIQHINIDPLLSVSSPSTLLVNRDALDFAISRQLESLLTICSIPIRQKNGTLGIALVDADPLNVAYEGRGSYFQFRALIQYQRLINATHEGIYKPSDLLDRIKLVCRHHLVWIMEFSQLHNQTWRDYYSISGESKTEEPQDLPNNVTYSYSVEGAYNFLKLCFFYATWKEDGNFVLKLLHSRLDQWLGYLVDTQHMSNLWAERIDIESQTPEHDNIANSRQILRAFPQYHLSDFALLWLCFLQLEELIQTLEEELFASKDLSDEGAKIMIQDVRKSLKSATKTLSRQGLQSNLLKTFKVPKEALIPRSASAEKNVASSETDIGNNSPSDVQKTASTDNPVRVGQIMKGEQISHFDVAGQEDSSIVFQRTIHEYTQEIQSSDMAVLEASIHGLFERSTGAPETSWHESLKFQQNIDLQTFNEPRYAALVLWAFKLKIYIARSNEDKIRESLRQMLSAALYDSGVFARLSTEEGPEEMKSWSARTYEVLFLYLGSRFDQCTMTPSLQNRLNSNRILSSQRLPMPSRSKILKSPRSIRIQMPGTVDASSRAKEKYVIDAVFLPDWMYFYPDFIHDKPLKITANEDLKDIKVFQSLEPAVRRMQTSNDFSDVDYHDVPFRPAVVDSGVKKAINVRSSYISREGRFKRFYLAKLFLDYLAEPRLPRTAKKRLIEFSSHDRTSALICLLASPRDEKPQFLDFLRRHDSSTNFFGECVDWRLNVWDTELHLAFYQLIDEENEIPMSKPSAFQSGLRTRNMPSLLGTSHLRKITPMVMSFRFVGDLRDRFWTCSFVSSASPTSGFAGFAYEAGRKKDPRNFILEEQAQRRLLQLSFVERMLEEMSKSIDIILAAFQKELDVPESRDPQSESFEFIFSYSSLYMKSQEILRDIWQRLEFSIQTVGEWEKREETRRLRSRWSDKDEERYGKKLRDLTQKCKSSLQSLRAQHKRLEEQKTFAEQRHNNLVSYMQLREARTSTRSSEDVRLFTYVTIIFLPLTFSSSLFSMQGAPHASTVSIMVQTTVVALVVTILFLSNLKLLDRNWSFHVHKLNALARSKMKASKHPWALDWHKKQMDLEEVAQRQISKMDYAKPLPAESKWWYFLFWLTYILRMPRIFIIDGFEVWQNNQEEPFLIIIRHTLLALFFAPACTFIFVMQLVLTTLVDFIYLLWVLACFLGRWLWDSSKSEPDKKEQAEDIDDQNDLKSLDTATSSAPSLHSEKHTRSRLIIGTLSSWLKYPPRPIHKKTRAFVAGQSKAKPPKLIGSDESRPILRSNTQTESEKLWAAAIKKRLTGEDERGASWFDTTQETQTIGKPPTSIHRNRTRLFERSKNIESRV